MRHATYVTAALAAALLGAQLLGGCASSGSSPPAVPAAAQGGGTAAGRPAGSARAAALHAAAQCIRQHGIPAYADPVLTPDGRLYTDSRSFDNAPQSTLNAVQQACGALAARAGLSPDIEPPAPPQLVQAGVTADECLRAHGLPDVQDPTARSHYTPGHGFGFTRGEIPAGGKASPVYQAAARACRPLLDDEIRASTLGSLGNDG